MIVVLPVCGDDSIIIGHCCCAVIVVLSLSPQSRCQLRIWMTTTTTLTTMSAASGNMDDGTPLSVVVLVNNDNDKENNGSFTRAALDLQRGRQRLHDDGFTRVVAAARQGQRKPSRRGWRRLHNGGFRREVAEASWQGRRLHDKMTMTAQRQRRVCSDENPRPKLHDAVAWASFAPLPMHRAHWCRGICTIIFDARPMEGRGVYSTKWQGSAPQLPKLDFLFLGFMIESFWKRRKCLTKKITSEKARPQFWFWEKIRGNPN